MRERAWRGLTPAIAEAVAHHLNAGRPPAREVEAWAGDRAREGSAELRARAARLARSGR